MADDSEGRRMTGGLHLAPSHWIKIAIRFVARCARFSHLAKTPRNPLKNNRSPDAHLAAFYLAIRQECRFGGNKNRQFRPVTALRPQNHGAIRRPSNQCAAHKNVRNRQPTLLVPFVWTSKLPPSPTFPAPQVWNGEVRPHRPW